MKTTCFALLFVLFGTVLSAQPTAFFTANQLTPDCSPVSMAFTNGSTGTDLSYFWDFGDGQTSTQEHPTHAFIGPSWFTVCLTVTEAGTGLQDTLCESYSFQQTDVDSVSINQQLCEGEQIIIDGVVLDISNPNGQFSFTNQAGCDSIVNVSLYFFPITEAYLEPHLCVGEVINVNSTEYSIDNPVGVEVMTNVLGCDSIIHINVMPNFLELQGSVSGTLTPGNTVTLTVDPVNGGGPYSYEWVDESGNVISTNGNTLVIDQEGQYSVVVMDIAGCAGDFVFDIIGSNNLEITPINFNPVTCEGDNNGQIIIDVFNGTPPYTYNWTPAVSTTNVLTDLAPGVYCVTVTDQIGATAEACYTIVQSTMDLIADFSQLSCNKDGFIDLEVVGGNAPFNYVWSNGVFTQDLSTLSSGNYTVTVVDSLGCTAFREFEIGNNFFYNYSITNTDCNVGIGSIVITGDSIATYTFDWSDGTTGPINENLFAGGYSVTIGDPTSDCIVEETFYVNETPNCYAVIVGNVWNDSSSPDCMADVDGGVQNVLVSITDGTNEQAAFTDDAGFYSFIVDEYGVHTITAEANTPVFELLCADPITVDVTQFDTTLFANDFYLGYTVYEDVEVSLSKTNARPGFTNTAIVAVYNGGAQLASGTASLIHPVEQVYSSAAPIADNYDSETRTVSWEYTDLAPGDYIVFQTFLTTPVGTALGTLLQYEASTTVSAADAILENNMTSCELEVTGSFDPNDKQVMPIGEGPEGYITHADSLLTYLVRFQNTGTDTAFTVVIRDTLDQDLEVSTLKPIAASHSFRTVMPMMNVVEFIFEDIMLPDSFINEPASNGFVSFSIELKKDLPYETEMTNRAGIYFDFNEPVITNTVVNTIESPNTIDAPQAWDIGLQLIPNPVDEWAVLSFEIEQNTDLSLQIISAAGHLERQTKLNGLAIGTHQQLMPVNDLPAGVYFAIAKDTEGNMARIKFVKL